MVLHYLGDQIFAVFGAPLFRENHPALAVQAAREMQHRLHTVNLALEQVEHAYRLEEVQVTPWKEYLHNLKGFLPKAKTNGASGNIISGWELNQKL